VKTYAAPPALRASGRKGALMRLAALSTNYPVALRFGRNGALMRLAALCTRNVLGN
jgi:hypothetical protein